MGNKIPYNDKRINSIFNCFNCSNIPLLGIKYENFDIYIEERCENGDYDFEKFNNFLERNKNNNSKIMQKNNIESYIYCKTCCTKLLTINNAKNCLNNNHKFLYLKNIQNSFCEKHNLFNNNYCTICNKNICDKELEDIKHSNHLDKIFHLKKYYIEKDQLNKIKNSIIEAEIDFNQFLLTIDKFLIDINKFLNDFKNSYKNFKILNENQINFCKDLINCYEYLSENNALNYEVIHNIKNIIHFKQLQYKIDDDFNILTKFQKYKSFVSNNYNCILERSLNKLNIDNKITKKEHNFLLEYFYTKRINIDNKITELKYNIELEDGNIYYGELLKDTKKPHGKGIILYKSGGKYIGFSNNGKINGYGVLLYKDGEKYKGYWKNDQRDGYGEYLYLNGEIYKGYFKKNKRNGYGIGYYLNGEVYKGKWINENIEEYGIRYYLNGDKYEGEWKRYNKEGIGIFTWLKFQRFEGTFKDDNLTGIGVLKKYKDYRYEGEFKNFTYCGFGIEYINNNILSYQGEWKDNQYNGYGIDYYDNGKKYYEGLWTDDRTDIFGVYYNKEGNIIYIGQTKEGEKNGFGKYIWPNGGISYSYWKNDLRNGFGQMYYKQGSKYFGEFKDDYLNGYGIYYWKNGDFYEGEWENDMQHGLGREYSNINKENNYNVWKNDITI